MRLKRNVTAALLGDPAPDRHERAEALRQRLPEPRAEIPLTDWLGPATDPAGVDTLAAQNG